MNTFNALPEIVVIAITVFGLFLAALWLLLPFFIIGLKQRIDITNGYLAEIKAEMKK
jgi:hypothetical protein